MVSYMQKDNPFNRFGNQNNSQPCHCDHAIPIQCNEDWNNDSQCMTIINCNNEGNSDPPKPLLTDEICGNITAPCNGEQTTLWQGYISSGFGSISIYYSNGCSAMKVYINDEEKFTINAGQTKAITVPQLNKLSIQCAMGTGVCTGTYSVNLHYERPSS